MNAVSTQPMVPDQDRIAQLEARVVRLEGILQADALNHTLSKILEEVSDIFGIEVLRLKGETRERVAAYARFAFCWVAHVRLGYSSVRVGLLLGGRDHTSVLYACKRAITLRVTNPDFLWETQELERRILKGARA